MEYEKFLTSGFEPEFKDKVGLYLISVVDDGHTVQSENRKLGGDNSANLKTGSRLIKVGLAGRMSGRMSGRLGDYYSHNPNGFRIHALFIKQTGTDSLGVESTKSRLAIAERAVLNYLDTKGLRYYKPGRVADRPIATEWAGGTITELKNEMLRLHKSSRNSACHAWFFSRDDAELMNTKDSGQKLSERVTANIGKPKPKPTPRSKNAMPTRTSTGVSTRNSTVAVP